MEEILLTLGSINHTIQAESVLEEAGVALRVMNMPSSIQSGCGLCLRVLPEDLPRVRRVLAENKLAVQSCYSRSIINGKSSYKALEVKGDG